MSKYRIIVAGGRDFSDASYFERKLDKIREELVDIEIVSGHASGADKLGELYAKKYGLDLKVFPADWKKYGRAAGPIRNKEMLSYIMEGNPLVAAFWDGQSKGTKNMIDQAKKQNVDCRVFLYNKESNLYDQWEKTEVVSSGKYPEGVKPGYNFTKWEDLSENTKKYLSGQMSQAEYDKICKDEFKKVFGNLEE